MKFFRILAGTALAGSASAVPAHHVDRHRRAEIDYVTKYVDQNGNPTDIGTQASSSAGAPSVVVTTVVEGTASNVEVNKAVQSTLAPSGGSAAGYSTAAGSGSSSGWASSATSSAPASSGGYSSGSGSATASGSSGGYSSGSGSATASSSSPSSSSSSGSSNSGSSGGGFQDGTISCSNFGISNYDGVVSLDWVNKGGWASVMDMSGNTADSCQDGYYCSYACKPGMSKTQWPSNQPSDGRSVGGLLCKNGKLHRSNTDTSQLCESGKSGSSAVNKKGQSIAMCRTDYPGSEDMVIPTVVGAGSSQPLSVVEEGSYYQWKGKKTSTQYYVNNAGVSKEDGCVWSNAGSGKGNWAPLVVGSGYSDGITYLSIIPNPNNKNSANFNVKIVGDNVDGNCKYEDGKFSGSDSDGCTAAVHSGSAQVVFY